jgi:hypothetical protein
MKNHNVIFVIILLILFIQYYHLYQKPPEKEGEKYVKEDTEKNTDTLILKLQPDGDEGKDAMVWTTGKWAKYKIPNQQRNYGNDKRLLAHAWTNSGHKDTTRILIYFNLSSIPEDVKIISAKLSLYNYENTSSFFGEHSGDNGGYIQRITSSWNENTVTWNTKPKSTSTNKVSYLY